MPCGCGWSLRGDLTRIAVQWDGSFGAAKIDEIRQWCSLKSASLTSPAERWHTVKGGLKGGGARADKMPAEQTCRDGAQMRPRFVGVNEQRDTTAFGLGRNANYTARRISLVRSIAVLEIASYFGLIARSAIAWFIKSGLSLSTTESVLVTSFLYDFNALIIEAACASPPAAMSKMSRGCMLDPR